MKIIKSHAIFFLLILIFSFPTYSQNKFEGKLQIDLKDKSGDNSMDYYIKGDMIRMDIQSAKGEAKIIFNKPDKKVIMLMPSMKMYMAFPWEKFEQNAAADKEGESDLDFKKTGETKKINGYLCEKWEMNDKEGTTEAWMTNELGNFLLFDSPLSAKSKTDWQSELSKSGNFPMLITHKNSSGKDDSKFIVKSVSKMSLTKEFFSVPDGYSELKMPAEGIK